MSSSHLSRLYCHCPCGSKGKKTRKTPNTKPYKKEIVKKNKLKERCVCLFVVCFKTSQFPEKNIFWPLRSTCFLAVNILKRLLLAGLIEQRDSQPLRKLMESVGDWPVAFEDWNSTMGKSNLSCLQFALNYYALAACAQGRKSLVAFKCMCLPQNLACVASQERFFSFAVRCGVWDRDEWVDVLNSLLCSL